MGGGRAVCLDIVTSPVSCYAERAADRLVGSRVLAAPHPRTRLLQPADQRLRLGIRPTSDQTSQRCHTRLVPRIRLEDDVTFWPLTGLPARWDGHYLGTYAGGPLPLPEGTETVRPEPPQPYLHEL